MGTLFAVCSAAGRSGHSSSLGGAVSKSLSTCNKLAPPTLQAGCLSDTAGTLGYRYGSCQLLDAAIAERIGVFAVSSDSPSDGTGGGCENVSCG